MLFCSFVLSHRNTTQSSRLSVTCVISMLEKHLTSSPSKSKSVHPLLRQSRQVDSVVLFNPIVSKFAKATGDFSRLAQTDLLLIALVYDLQKEISGLDRINIAPLINVLA